LKPKGTPKLVFGRRKKRVTTELNYAEGRKSWGRDRTKSNTFRFVVRKLGHCRFAGKGDEKFQKKGGIRISSSSVKRKERGSEGDKLLLEDPCLNKSRKVQQGRRSWPSIRSQAKAGRKVASQSKACIKKKSRDVNAGE